MKKKRKKFLMKLSKKVKKSYSIFIEIMEKL